MDRSVGFLLCISGCSILGLESMDFIWVCLVLWCLQSNSHRMFKVILFLLFFLVSCLCLYSKYWFFISFIPESTLVLQMALKIHLFSNNINYHIIMIITINITKYLIAIIIMVVIMVNNNKNREVKYQWKW